MSDNQSTTYGSVRKRTGEHPARKYLSLRWLQSSMAPALLVVLYVAAAPAGALSMRASESTDPNLTASINPVADWIEDIIEQLEGIEEILADAQEAVGEQQGPLSEPELSWVADDLDATLALIDEVLPLLEPSYAGSIDNGVNPGALPGYAHDCLALAKDAVDEATSTLPDAKVVGGHLKTIEHLITRASPHNYRTRAGIE